MTQQSTERIVPVQNALCRCLASFLTWPIEKSKLIYQAEGMPIVSRLIVIPTASHIRGALASCAQRGGSAFLMFFIQGKMNVYTSSISISKSVNEAVAGALAGLISAPFHTYWELMKIRLGQPVTMSSYRAALLPMMLRHSVFDGSFFYVNDLFSDYSSATRFGLAAASASFCNLIFDVWKTQRMHRYPQHTPLFRVLASLRISTFLSNYVVKGIDLTANWTVVGIIKDSLT